MLGAILPAAASVASGFLAGRNNNQTQTTEPWTPQGNVMRVAFNRGRDLFSRQEQNPLPFFPGQTYADFDPYLTRALSAYGEGAFSPYQQANQSVLQSNLRNTPTGAVGAYARVLNNPLAGVNMDTVNQAINNPVLEGQIDAVNRDTARGLQDALKNTRYGAALTGNAGSTSRTLSEGLQARAAGDRMADVAAQMRGGAYGMGYQTAANQALANQRATLAAGQGYGNLASTYAGFLDQGAGLADRGLQRQMGAGQMLTEQDQRRINEEMARYNYPLEQERGNINWLRSLAGGNVPGGTVSSGGGMSPLASGALAGLGTISNMYMANPNLFGGGNTPSDQMGSNVQNYFNSPFFQAQNRQAHGGSSLYGGF